MTEVEERLKTAIETFENACRVMPMDVAVMTLREVLALLYILRDG